MDTLMRMAKERVFQLVAWRRGIQWHHFRFHGANIEVAVQELYSAFAVAQLPAKDMPLQRPTACNQPTNLVCRFEKNVFAVRRQHCRGRAFVSGENTQDPKGHFLVIGRHAMNSE